MSRTRGMAICFAALLVPADALGLAFKDKPTAAILGVPEMEKFISNPVEAFLSASKKVNSSSMDAISAQLSKKFKDPKFSDKLTAAIDRIQKSMQTGLYQIDSKVNLLVQKSASIETRDQLKPLLETFLSDAAAVIDEFSKNATAAVKDFMNLLGTEVTKSTETYMTSGNAMLGGMVGLTRMKAAGLSLLDNNEVCERFNGALDGESGLPGIERNLTDNIPVINGSKGMLPLMMNSLTTAHPEMVGVSNLADHTIDVMTLLAEQARDSTRNFNTKVGNVLTSKMDCTFRSPSCRPQLSQALFSTLLLVAMAWLAL